MKRTLLSVILLTSQFSFAGGYYSSRPDRLIGPDKAVRVNETPVFRAILNVLPNKTHRLITPSVSLNGTDDYLITTENSDPDLVCKNFGFEAGANDAKTSTGVNPRKVRLNTDGTTIVTSDAYYTSIDCK